MSKSGGIVKERERPGRGCACCPEMSRKESRRWARRTAKLTLRKEW